MLTSENVRAVVGRNARQKIIDGFVDGVGKYGPEEPWRLAHLSAQVFHESAGLRARTEYASGAAYEGRRDLGNTRKGDGRRYKGRGLIQNTGRDNYTRFNLWCRSNIPNSPDFVQFPEKVAEFPWAFLVTHWYWNFGNPTRKSLSLLADDNKFEMITRRVNGGMNGFSDRARYYTRTGLVLLGYTLEKGVVREFQRDSGLVADGISGPVTRGEIHNRLRKISTVASVVEKVVSPTPQEEKISLLALFLNWLLRRR